MTKADAALLVANHHKGGEGEPAAAFDGGRDAVDVHQLLDDVAVGTIAAALRGVAIATSALTAFAAL